MMTATPRKRLAISKQFADQYKPEMPAITVSGTHERLRQTTCRLPQTYLHVTARLRPCEEGRYGAAPPTGERRQSYDGRVCHRERQGISEYSVPTVLWMTTTSACSNSSMPCCRRRSLITPSSWVSLPTSSVSTSPDAPVLPTTRMPPAVGMPSLLPSNRRNLNPLYTKKALQAKYSARRNAGEMDRSSKVKEEAKSGDKGAPTHGRTVHIRGTARPVGLSVRA